MGFQVRLFHKNCKNRKNPWDLSAKNVQILSFFWLFFKASEKSKNQQKANQVKIKQ